MYRLTSTCIHVYMHTCIYVYLTHCNTLQGTATPLNTLHHRTLYLGRCIHKYIYTYTYVHMYIYTERAESSMLQGVAGCCRVLQGALARFSSEFIPSRELQHAIVCCSVLQCVAVCWECVAECCSRVTSIPSY